VLRTIFMRMAIGQQLLCDNVHKLL